MAENCSSPTPGNSSCGGSQPSALLTALLGAALSLMCVLGLAGNLYTLAAVSARIRTTGSLAVYIVNLALADVLYLCTIPFVVCTYFTEDWYFGDVGCRVLFSVDLLSMHASIFLLTIMSAERYLAVARPFDTLGRCTRYRRAVTGAAWLAAFLLALPTAVMIELRRVLRDGVPRHMCHPTWRTRAYKVYLTVLFSTCIVVPGVTIGCLYTRLARTYWASQSVPFAAPGARGCPKRKVFYLILAIVLAYWACFLPFWLWQLLSVYCFGHGSLSRSTTVYVNFAVTCLAYGNSCINPFLYTLLSRNYRESARGRRKSPAGASAFKSRRPSQRSVSSGSHQLTDTPTVVRLNGLADGCSV